MGRLRFPVVLATGVVAAVLAVVPALAQESEETSPAPDVEVVEAPATKVGVTLQEWAVVPESQSLAAGSLTFDVENVGPADPHEFVVVRTDIPAADLPTKEDGSFDEEAEGVEVIGEIEEFDPGTTQSATFDLAAGKYVFLCNLVEEEEDGALEAHYQMGMRVDVEVVEAPATKVGVTLQEWAVVPESQSLAAGSLTFDVENVGPADPHEFVVVRTDIPAADLPTKEDGSFDEEAEGVEVIGEIEEFDPGTTQSATFDLAAGKYVFLCNLVEEEEDGALEAHYQMGMRVDVEVT